MSAPRLTVVTTALFLALGETRVFCANSTLRGLSRAETRGTMTTSAGTGNDDIDFDV